jgi:hypothetical protein
MTYLDFVRFGISGARHTILEPAHRVLTESWQLERIRQLVGHGARLIVCLHEIAHYLLGHLHHTSHAEVDQELMADDFALSVLRANGENLTGFLLAGAELPFLLLSTDPSSQGSTTHPPPLERAIRVHEYRRTLYNDLVSSFYEYVLCPLYFCVLGQLGLDTGIYQREMVDRTISLLRAGDAFEMGD